MLLIFIFFLFYCGLMVHITDTRAQKVVSYTSAHITETVLHVTNTGRSKAVYPDHSCIVIYKSTANG